jgi:hypothetical protein
MQRPRFGAGLCVSVSLFGWQVADALARNTGSISPGWQNSLHSAGQVNEAQDEFVWMLRFHVVSNLLKNRPDLTRQKLERTRQLMDSHHGATGSDALTWVTL